MRKLLTFFCWTLAIITAAWLAALLINRNIFLHTNINQEIQGVIHISDTDIDTKCGKDAKHHNDTVEYKLNHEGEIVYLCPVTLWPIQKEIVAESLTGNFRHSLTPAQADAVAMFYPLPPSPLIPVPAIQ